MMRIILEKATEEDKSTKMLVNAGLLSEEEAKALVKKVKYHDLHAFTNTTGHNWINKYLIGVFRLLIDYVNGDASKIDEFINQYKSDLDWYLTKYILKPDVRTPENKDQLDSEFLNKISLNDLMERIKKLQAESASSDDAELSKQQFGGSSNYELIPIESRSQFVDLFDQATGDGEDEPGGYCGDGKNSSGWCYLSDGTYSSNTHDGSQFFVLARKGWEDIPFDPETNQETHGLDDYGTSLIAFLVGKNGRVKKCTLRCNHKGSPRPDADGQFGTSYAGLSKQVGFNVKEAVYNYLGLDTNAVNPSTLVYTGGHLSDYKDDYDDIGDIKTLKIKDCSQLSSNLFKDFVSLEQVIIEDDKLVKIGSSVFENCSSLKTINLPDSIRDIEDKVFAGCTSLQSIKLPKNLSTLSVKTFLGCTSLSSVELPDSLNRIASYTFAECSSLVRVEFPESITRIGLKAFQGCSSLEEVVIPNADCELGTRVFDGVSNSFVVYIEEGGVTQESCDRQGYDYRFITR